MQGGYLVTPVEITSVIAGLFVSIVTGGTTLYTTRSKKKIDAAKIQTDGWDNFTSRIQQERDSLLLRVNNMETAHRKEIQDLKSEYSTQIASLELRNKELQTQVDDLYRRLYSREM